MTIIDRGMKRRKPAFNPSDARARAIRRPDPRKAGRPPVNLAAILASKQPPRMSPPFPPHGGDGQIPPGYDTSEFDPPRGQPIMPPGGWQSVDPIPGEELGSIGNPYTDTMDGGPPLSAQPVASRDLIASLLGGGMDETADVGPFGPGQGNPQLAPGLLEFLRSLGGRRMAPPPPGSVQ